MPMLRWTIAALLFTGGFGAAGTAAAQFVKNDPAPAINTVDVFGNTVKLDDIIQQGRDVVILFFFSPQTGQEMAHKLATLDTYYGGKQLEIIALGFKEDAAALRKFAENFQIQYAVIDAASVKDAEWVKKIDVLPLTLFVVTETKTIERVIRGGGQETQLIKEAAEAFFRRGQLEQAAKMTQDAIKAGENPKDAQELNGYILTAEGKLDDAEKEFGQIDSKTGLAKVAVERGQFSEAVQLADQAGNDGYAQTIKAEALMKEGKTEEAAKTLETAGAPPAREWQQSETQNLQGRVLQEQGKTDDAIGNYEKAVALDPYNVVALSNEGAAHREKGDLKKAEQVLEKASSIRKDDMASLMLQQVQRELKEANDTEKAKLIQTQIADLAKRFQEMKTAGTDKPADTWSTRPLVLAFLPSAAQGPLFFDRAGTDIVVQRELENRLLTSNQVGVVERQMLDKLLQELQLGSSELASADTQRRLGQVLSAGMLGFLDFAQAGPDIMIYLRLVDTETTAITFQTSDKLNENNPGAAVQTLVNAILAQVVNSRELKGLIADAASDDAVIINLGKKHGVKEGQVFTAYVDGDPIEVGGRVIAHRQKPVGKLTVTAVEDDYAVCNATNKAEGAVFAKEMKVKAAK